MILSTEEMCEKCNDTYINTDVHVKINVLIFQNRPYVLQFDHTDIALRLTIAASYLRGIFLADYVISYEIHQSASGQLPVLLYAQSSRKEQHQADERTASHAHSQNKRGSSIIAERRVLAPFQWELPSPAWCAYRSGCRNKYAQTPENFLTLRIATSDYCRGSERA